jgi:hypothetical protein
LPSAHKAPAQEQAEEELLVRLVALNHERAAEEKRGLVRWLRPDYQIPKLGKKAPGAKGEQIEADVSVVEISERPRWPSDGLDQIRLVRDLLSRFPAPAHVDEISVAFEGRNTAKRSSRVAQVLDTLVATGLARPDAAGGRARYFVPR